MTNEEAIEWLKEMMPEWDYEANIYCAETCYGLGEYICTEPEGYVFKTAIEALEKQIPKKPRIKHSLIDTIYLCPVCGTSSICFYEIQRRFCSNCGQAIDWSEEDE